MERSICFYFVILNGIASLNDGLARNDVQEIASSARDSSQLRKKKVIRSVWQYA